MSIFFCGFCRPLWLIFQQNKRGDPMKRRVLLLAISAFLMLQSLPVAAATCESLASLKLPDATITQSESVAAGAFVPAGGGGRGGGAQFSDLPAFCRVAATLKPT